MMDYGKFTIEGTDYYIKESPFPEGCPRCYCLYQYSKQENPVAYALIYQEAVETQMGTRMDHTAQLWHIWTQDDCRRKGLATSLIDFLKRKFIRIITQIATKEGKNLCIKNGFTYRPAVNKGGTDWLIWKKGEKDARNTQKTYTDSK